MVVENSKEHQKETAAEKIQTLSKLAEELSFQIEALPKIPIGNDLPIETIRLHLKYGKTLFKIYKISFRNYFTSFFAQGTKPEGGNMDEEIEIAFSVLEIVRIALEPKKNPNQIPSKIGKKSEQIRDEIRSEICSEICTLKKGEKSKSDEISGRNGANKNDTKNDTKIDKNPKITSEKREKIESAENKTDEKNILEKKELLAMTYKSLAKIFFECDDYENFIDGSIKANQTFELLKNVTTLKTKQLEIDIKICANFVKMSDCCIVYKDNDKALQFFKKGEEKLKSIKKCLSKDCSVFHAKISSLQKKLDGISEEFQTLENEEKRKLDITSLPKGVNKPIVKKLKND